MHIIAINNTNNISKNTKSNPNFKGELKGYELIRVLEMLKEKISSVKICNDFGDIDYIANDLIIKNQCLGVKTAGAMIIPDETLSSFVGNKIPQHLKLGKKGLCVAVGDKIGPIESWNEVYDSVLVLLPKYLFKSNI